MLSIKNISKHFKQGTDQVSVIQGLSLEIEKGSTTSITGPSGCGKTTLLSLMAALDRPDSGEILFNGLNLAIASESEINQYRSSSMGIVFQQFHLMPHLTALENVMLPLEINGIENPKEQALEFLNQVKLSHRVHHFPSQLSGGESQRVAIARAFVHSPDIVFADEPTGNLDQGTSETIMELLFGLLSQHQMTFVLVTHDRQLAKECDHQIELNNKVS